MVSLQPLPCEQTFVQPVLEPFNYEGHPTLDDMEEYKPLEILTRPMIDRVALHAPHILKVWSRLH